MSIRSQRNGPMLEATAAPQARARYDKGSNAHGTHIASQFSTNAIPFVVV